MRTHFSLLAFFLAGSVLAAPKPEADNAALVEAGRRIYEEGILPDGAPLQGIREGGTVASGRDAACVLCHQRSGMGLAEGGYLVPPITGPALFDKLELATYGRAPRRAPGMEFKDWPFKTRRPYTDATLAQAMRTGVSPTGYRFQYMMPRYELKDADMKALLRYLRSLSVNPSPGVSAGNVQIATVVAADVEPARRKIFLEVVNACFSEKFPLAKRGVGGGEPGSRLHIWELKGSPVGWYDQLSAYYAQQPVFAVLSGLGSDEWGPVELFCEANGVPCLFPNVDVPGGSEGTRYSVYFSRGALVEAEVIASYLSEHRNTLGIRRVITLSREDGAGAQAAAILARRLSDNQIVVEQQYLGDPGEAEGLNGLARAGRQDVVVVLLRAKDLKYLSEQLIEPPKSAAIVISGLLGGLEDVPLPRAWRERVLMSYPFDGQHRWEARMRANLRPWLATNNISVSDQRLQGNTLTACNFLVEAFAQLRGQLFRDYLVEKVENYDNSMGNAGAPSAFPRLSLGPSQRFASKGAYLVRFAPPEYRTLVLEHDWIVP